LSLSNQRVSNGLYTCVVPRLWTETIETHRREVHDAILDGTAELAAKHGLLSVTMSRIAEETGIGRATLYKYFSDVESILLAWHEREITGHLEHLSQARDAADDPRSRLKAVLEAYAFIDHEHHGSERRHRHLQDPALSALLHRGGHVARAHRQLSAMIRDLISEAARTGSVRGDVSPAELANYCLSALEAARTLPSKAAVRRLVNVTLDGLGPSRGSRRRKNAGPWYS
ncbi:MAG TPA: TetR/AcrR family transcriptional regulator, partial [Actinomycetota bacterium]|nr:TetR/AcrR family transcriptional regulator [Actinomycetota bacterium]